ncbi:MAG: hypothetical protein ACI9YT_003069 [Halobacteriales archaeon]|jgi:hypothetical protein
MNRILTILAVGMVFLAGCAGNVPWDSTSAPTPTPTDGVLAPGLTEAGIVNPIALQSAHRQTLLADGFASNTTYESVGDGTVQFRTSSHLVVGPGGELALERSTASDLDAYLRTHDVWHNVSHTTTRTVEDGDAEYAVRGRVTPPEAIVWPGPVLRVVQDNARKYEVTTVEDRDGTRFTTLSAAIGDDGTSTIVVDDRGAVLTVESTTTYGGSDVWHVTYTVERIGDVRPQAPAWLAEVPTGANLDVHLFVDMVEGLDGVIALEHIGGDVVPAGTFVALLQDETTSEAQLGDPLRPDETRFVYLGADAGDLRVSTIRPGTEHVRPIRGEFTIRVVTPEGVTLFEERLGWV